jgi:glycosyltransferase involved in cell wall biosynthesis
MSARGAEPYLIMIRSGPVWRLEGKIHHIAEVFQRRFEGEILTWGSKPGFMQVGRIQVRRWVMSRSRSLPARALYMTRLLWRAARARWLLRRPLLVVSYDPFQSGVTAALMKRLTGARFICEVNGDYANPRTLVDMDDADARREKRESMLAVGSRVLRGSDAVKLLFHGQIAGFDVEDGEPVRFCFPNLVDTRVFEPSGEARRRQILFVGQPYHLKGVDILLEAFDRVAPDFPDWELVCLGFRLGEQAEGVSFPPDRVRFLDPVAPAEVVPIMDRAAFLVLPSRSEGMGRVLVEAAHMGLPRVGSDTGGIPTVIEHGIDGLVVPPEDVEALAEALATLMADPDLRETMGRAARERALREFTEEAYLAHWDRLLSRVAPDRLPAAHPGA